MKCPKCATELADSEKFCWKCYTPLGGAAEAAPAPAAARPGAPRPTAARRSPKPRSALLSVIPVVLLLAAAGGGYYYWSEYTGPKACARAFCAAVEKQDGKVLFALLSANSKQGMSPEMAAMMFGGMRAGGGPSIKMTPKQVIRKGDTVEVKVAMAFGLGKTDNATTMTMTMPLIMVKEAGGWRVDMMASQRAQMEAMGVPRTSRNDWRSSQGSAPPAR